MRKLILFITFLLMATCLLGAQESRRISGKVVDENGEIVGQSFIGSRGLEDWKAVVDSVFASME